MFSFLLVIFYHIFILLLINIQIFISFPITFNLDAVFCTLHNLLWPEWSPKLLQGNLYRSQLLYNSWSRSGGHWWHLPKKGAGHFVHCILARSKFVNLTLFHALLCTTVHSSPSSFDTMCFGYLTWRQSEYLLIVKYLCIGLQNNELHCTVRNIIYEIISVIMKTFPPLNNIIWECNQKYYHDS